MKPDHFTLILTVTPCMSQRSISVPPSCPMSEMRVALHSACNPLLQTDYWFVAQVLFRTLTAVVMVSSSQSHSHGGKCWFKGYKRTQDQTQQPEEQGQSIHKSVREVVTWSSISQTHQHIGHKVPEPHWLIIGNMIWLGMKREEYIIKQLFTWFGLKVSAKQKAMKSLTLEILFSLTFPHMGESGFRCSAARMCPWTTFSTKVKSTKLVPSLQKTKEKNIKDTNTAVYRLSHYLTEEWGGSW